MKFDKSKILTCVTAWKATVGMNGWFSDNLMDLEDQIKSNSPKGVISDIGTMRAPNRFVDKDTTAWNLFYPAPELTYAERQAEWVKENGVKEGTRVRITKDYSEDSDARTLGHTGVAGKCGTVNCVGNSYINVNLDSEDFYLLTVPYYAMEVIKESEQTYKPITGFETGKWYVCHLNERPSAWSSYGGMDGLLDGKPHKCVMGYETFATFEDIPLCGELCWSFRSTIDYFEEVPSPVTSYSERQAEWVKANNVRVDTKVRFTKNFTNGEDGSWCCGHNDAKGMEGVVKYIGGDSLTVLVPYFGAWWAVPFTALEVIKEPTYAERQAEWVKENNVTEGTKVRVTRTFTEDEDGSFCLGHDDLVGMIGSVDEYGIVPHSLGIIMSDGYYRAIPYFALEVIKEPTYRPYNNDELNDLVGEVLTNKKSGRKMLVTGKPTEALGVNLDGSYITAKDLLSSFYRNTNETCGIKE